VPSQATGRKRADSQAANVHRVLLQKLPDLLVLILLFVPASSRQYFRP